MRRYDESPEGWQVWVGKDRKGFLDLLISHGSELWQVKEFQLNPYKVVGYGARACKSTLAASYLTLPVRTQTVDRLSDERAGWLDR